MGVLPSSCWERYQRIEAEPGRAVAKPRSSAGGGVEAEDADFSAQQDPQDIEPDFSASPAVSRFARQPDKGYWKRFSSDPQGAADRQKPAKQD